MSTLLLKSGQISLVSEGAGYKATFDIILDAPVSGLSATSWKAQFDLTGFPTGSDVTLTGLGSLGTNGLTDTNNPGGANTWNIGWLSMSPVVISQGLQTIAQVVVTLPSLTSQELATLNVGVTMDSNASYLYDGSSATVPLEFAGSSLNYGEMTAPPTVLTTVKVDGSAPVDLNTNGKYDLDASDGVVEVTYTFSKPVTGFDQSDISATGFGAPTTFTPSTDGKTYVATFGVPTQNTLDASISISGATGATDAYGNPLSNPSPVVVRFEGDTMAPATPLASGLSIRGTYQDPTSFDGVVGSWVPFTATLSGETDAVFYLDGVLVEPEYTMLSASILNGALYVPEEGSHSISYAVVDQADNVSEVSSPISFTVDAMAPELVSVVQKNPSWATANTNELWFEVTFDEAVSAVDFSDFVLTVGGKTYELSDATLAFGADVRTSGNLMPYYSNTGGGGSTSTLDDTYYVRVGTAGLSAVATQQAIADATLAVKSLIREVSTEPLGSTAPTDIDLAAGGAAGGTNTRWFKVSLSGEIGTSKTLSNDSVLVGVSDPGWAGGQPTVDYVKSSSTDPSVIYVRVTTSGTFPSEIHIGVNNTKYGSDSVSPIGGSNIVDAAGNYYGSYNYESDEEISLDPATAYGQVTAPDSISGWDVLDLTDLHGSVVVYATGIPTVYFTAQGAAGTGADYLIGEFDKYVIDSSQAGTEFYGSDRSEVINLSGTGATIEGGGVSGDNSTDIVSYGRTQDDIDVDLSDMVAGEVEVVRGAQTDLLKGIEGVIGGSGADSITGSRKDNILFGENYRTSDGEVISVGGNDTLDGGSGDDILFGGAGQNDVLKGGAGKDILIDFDGGTLRGDVESKSPVDVGTDIYVVRTGQVNIENLHLSGPGTGLSGRSHLANDVVVFSFNVAALAATIADVVQTYTLEVDGSDVVNYEGLASDVYDHIRYGFEAVANTDSQNLVLYYDADGLEGSDVVLGKVKLTDINLQLQNPAGRPFSLEAVEIEGYSLMDQVSDKLDPLMVDRLVGGLFSDEVLDVAIALEAVREGTQRESNARGVMSGDNSLEERIFNPGFGDQRIVGSNKSDRYEFITQDFKEDNGGQYTTNAGKDKVFDTGGTDVLTFEDAHLVDLDFTAIAQGRESSPSSLKVSYTQTTGQGANAITNTGEVTWTGHYREGGDLALESVSTADGDFAVAKTVYSYDEFGDRIDRPDLVASGGVDSIMVGRYDTAAAGEDSFVITKGEGFDAGDDGNQNIYLWNVNYNDTINLDGFVKTSATVVDNHTVKIQTTDNVDLMLHFMDLGVTQDLLDQMLVQSV